MAIDIDEMMDKMEKILDSKMDTLDKGIDSLDKGISQMTAFGGHRNIQIKNGRVLVDGKDITDQVKKDDSGNVRVTVSTSSKKVDPLLGFLSAFGPLIKWGLLIALLYIIFSVLLSTLRSPEPNVPPLNPNKTVERSTDSFNPL